MQGRDLRLPGHQIHRERDGLRATWPDKERAPQIQRIGLGPKTVPHQKSVCLLSVCHNVFFDGYYYIYSYVLASPSFHIASGFMSSPPELPALLYCAPCFLAVRAHARSCTAHCFLYCEVLPRWHKNSGQDRRLIYEQQG